MYSLSLCDVAFPCVCKCTYLLAVFLLSQLRHIHSHSCAQQQLSREHHGIAIIAHLRRDVLAHSASGVCLQVLDAETQADQDDDAEEYIEADEEEEEEEEEDVDLEREIEYEDDEVGQQASQMQNDNTFLSMGVDKHSTHTVLHGFCQWPQSNSEA